MGPGAESRVSPRHAAATIAGIALCLTAFAATARAACNGLALAGGYAAGTSPQMVVLADVDGDGRLDALVANGSGNTFNVLRALPTGGFAAPLGYTGGTKARALAVADFEGDGRTDVALAVNAGVMLWLGNGDGTFRGGALVSVGSGARGVVCADFDGDGITDLAVASSSTNDVQVLRGGGSDTHWDGTFGVPATYPAGTSPARLVSGDWNEDGILDLACTSDGSKTVTVLLGTGVNGRGDGAFVNAGTVALTGSPFGLASADLDGDGHLDLVASDAAGSVVRILRGDGHGGFTLSGTAACAFGAEDVVLADIDGDGRADVLVAAAGPGQTSWLRGHGDRTFDAPVNFACGGGSFSIAAGDLDGDGIVDAVCANSSANSLTRLLGTCRGGAATGLTLLTPAGGEGWWPGQPQVARWSKGAAVLAVDLDLSRDGGVTWTPLARALPGDHAPVVISGAATHALRVRVRDTFVPSRMSTGAADFTLCARFAPPVSTTFGDGAATRMLTGDVDGDGETDVIALDATRASVLRGDGHGGFARIAQIPMTAPACARLSDADGDARADLVTAEGATVLVRLGDGLGGFGSARAVACPTRVVDAAFVDLDLDGVPDLVALCDDGTQGLLVTRRGAGTSYEPAVVRSVVAAPARLAFADFDRDGTTDVLVTGASAMQIAYGHAIGGHADGSLTLGAARALTSSTGDVTITDLDHDGVPDVLACVPASGDLWLLTGAGASASPASGASANAFAAPLAIATGAAAATPVVADFDGDGAVDLALAQPGGDAVVLLPGRFGGGFAAPVRFNVPGGARAIAAGDPAHTGGAGLIVLGGDQLRVTTLGAQCSALLSTSLALAPLAAETWTEGSAHMLRWSRGAGLANVQLELSRDDGAHWVSLAESVTDTQFVWIATGPATDSLRLRVRDAAAPGRFDVTPRLRMRTLLGTARTSAALPLPAAAACVIGATDGLPLLATSDGRQIALAQVRDDGAHESTRVAAYGARRLAFTDLDRDGVDDLVQLGDAGVAVRMRHANGALDSLLIVTGPIDAADLCVRDLDEDGIPDLALATGTGVSSRVRLWRGRGDGGFDAGTSVITAATPSALVCGDVNRDGIADLIVCQSNGIATLLGTGTAGHGDGGMRLLAQRSFGPGGATCARLVDFDGDGLLDLVVADTMTRALWIAAGDGTGRFGDPLRVPLSFAPRALACADLDGDGRLDLLACGEARMAVIRDAGGAFADGRFVPIVTRTLPGGGAGLLACDVTGDGVSDVIAVCDSGTVLVPGTCGSALANALSLDAPLAGATFTIGSEHDLAWSAGAAVALVDVQLSRDGGRQWETLASDVRGGHFAWTVTGPATGAALLRVRDARVPQRRSQSLLMASIEPAALAVGDATPRALALAPPAPNPSRGACVLHLALPRASHVRAEVCDIAGRSVRALADAPLGAGVHSIAWDGRDARGTRAAAGVYFVRVRVDGTTLQQRVVRVE